MYVCYVHDYDDESIKVLAVSKQVKLLKKVAEKNHRRVSSAILIWSQRGAKGHRWTASPVYDLEYRIQKVKELV